MNGSTGQNTRRFAFESLDDGIGFVRKAAHRINKSNVTKWGWLIKGYLEADLCIILDVSAVAGGTTHEFYLLFHRVPLRNDGGPRSPIGKAAERVADRGSAKRKWLKNDLQSDAMLPVGYLRKLSRNLLINGTSVTSAVWLQTKQDGVQFCRDAAVFARKNGPQAVLSLSPREAYLVVGANCRNQSLAGGEHRLIEGVFERFDGFVCPSVYGATQMSLEAIVDNFLAGFRIHLNAGFCYPALEALFGFPLEIRDCFHAPCQAFLRSVEE